MFFVISVKIILNVQKRFGGRPRAVVNEMTLERVNETIDDEGVRLSLVRRRQRDNVA